ncbi:hypothetical protein Clacol_002839 [Clathrus columnatus]|uniref:UvrD-like helicase ATP-binding domain-containing protein n=1 Tax=Clathrus columnatus TaxID=1419009 RepID=A0AAV5A9N4_9AGAM|nr:hypothetical protein Clacol_002839 [Clathrus columnatus]
MLSLDALGLNEEQLQGKTKVLTTRIAHLVENHGLEPSQICALTFTKRAAKEMKERLKKLMGKQKTNQLVMDNAVIHRISQAKVKQLLPTDLPNQTADIKQQLIETVYQEYITTLKQSNSLDFDDLLLHCIRLFSREPKSLSWCKHVLVDEL